MLFGAAMAAIRSHVETGWAASAYAAVPLIWANEYSDPTTDLASFVYVSIEGNGSDKTVIGSTGLRVSQEYGIVYYSAFVPEGSGATTATAMVDTIAGLLELQAIATEIKMDGADPASPADPTEVTVPNMQPGGAYYRVSGSVPFNVISTR